MATTTAPSTRTPPPQYVGASKVTIRNNAHIVIEPELGCRYQIAEMLGTGAYGTVFAASDLSTQRLVAVKVVSRERLGPEGQIKIEREVQIMQSLDHPRILRMLGFIPSANFFNIILEKVNGGELFTHLIRITRYTERKACRVVFNVLRALKYMHGKGFMHSDIKPENLLLVKKPEKDEEVTSVKLADFGLAQIVQPPHNVPTKCCGSPMYIAPEILQVAFQKTRPYYDQKADMWALGVVTYLLLSGLIPFYGATPNETFKATLQTRHNFNNKVWEPISEEGKDFISKLFVKAPEQRMSAAQALEHPWMLLCEGTDADWDVDLPESLEGIKRFNAQTKLKGAMYGVEATFRLAYLSGCEAHKLKPNSRLEELMTSTTQAIDTIDLTGNYVGPANLRVLSEALVLHSQVRVLNLTNVMLDDFQLESLGVDFLRPQCRLHTLILDTNLITHAGGRLLVDLARMRSQYLNISVHGNHIKASVLKRLAAQLAENRKHVATHATFPDSRAMLGNAPISSSNSVRECIHGLPSHTIL